MGFTGGRQNTVRYWPRPPAASAQPRSVNRATLGGNIGWRIGCLLPALLALDAELDVLTAARRTETLALADWLTAPASPVSPHSGLSSPPSRARKARTGFRKIGLRAAFTPSVIAVAGALSNQRTGSSASARLAVGGGPVPAKRASATAERGLTGQRYLTTSVDWSTPCGTASPGCDCRARRCHSAAPATAGAPARMPWSACPAGSLPGALSGAAARSGRPRPAPADEEVRVSRADGGNRWHIRPDLPAKIAAQMPYLTDARRDDMLVGATLRLDVPHARILSIDTSAAEALPGVKAVVTHRDIQGENSFGIVFPDQPALCSDKVRYLGDPVAALQPSTARRR
jgi:hypothetical protein